MNKKDIKEYHETIEKLTKSLNQLPKLKQDIIKSVTQNSLNKKYGDVVENIIERKMKSQTMIGLFFLGIVVTIVGLFIGYYIGFKNEEERKI